eukprot:1914064-Rhodomonas_salina.3
MASSLPTLGSFRGGLEYAARAIAGCPASASLRVTMHCPPKRPQFSKQLGNPQKSIWTCGLDHAVREEKGLEGLNFETLQVQCLLMHTTCWYKMVQYDSR